MNNKPLTKATSAGLQQTWLRLTWLRLTWISLKVFIAHYRHAPIQAGAILLGIALAVTLLIGVKATNDNAVRSYSDATELLSQRADVLLTRP